MWDLAGLLLTKLRSKRSLQCDHSFSRNYPRRDKTPRQRRYDADSKSASTLGYPEERTLSTARRVTPLRFATFAPSNLAVFFRFPIYMRRISDFDAGQIVELIAVGGGAKIDVDQNCRC